MTKAPLVLEQSGLIIELYNKKTNQVYVTYSACTHGGWAKYLNRDNEPVENFEYKSEIIEDANKLAKYYNTILEIAI